MGSTRVKWSQKFTDLLRLIRSVRISFNVPSLTSADEPRIRYQRLLADAAQSEAKYRTLFKSVDQGICVLEIMYDARGDAVDYKFIEYNQTFEKQTGLQNAVGKTAYSLVPELDPFWVKTYAKVAATGESIRFEQDSPAMNRVFDVFAFRIGDAPSTRVGLLFSDVTERKRAQIAFERNVDGSPAILWITEVDGSCTYLSQQWYEYTGQTKEQALGFGWLDATHPDDKKRTADIYIQANKEQKPFYAEYRLKTKDGGYRWAIDAGNPRYDVSGKYLGYAGTVFDIHEQKIASDEIQALQIRFQRTAAAADLGVWYCDLPFDILTWNNEVKRHFFLPPETVVTIDLFYERIHPDDREPTRLAIAHSIETRTPYDTVYRTTNPNDPTDTKSIRAVGWTDYNSEGLPIRFDGLTLDVSLELKRNLELQAAKEQAERANELKSAFLANMSHEIRTPLGAMIGFADLLRDPSVSATERANFIDILSRNGESLSVIINDILDLSKVEAGHLVLEFTDVAPTKLVEDALSLLRVKAKEKGLSLIYKCETNSPSTIVADSHRIRQILLNIVGNAIKFTQFGSITVRSYGGESENGRTGLCIEVVDTGIGIPTEQKESVFQVFVQADNSTSRRFGGTGLGLALSRSLARSMGGDIQITKSEPGKGSTFLIQIADQPQSRNVDATLSSGSGRRAVEITELSFEGLKILIVDDSPDNQQLIWRYLNKRGVITNSAEDGYKGVRMALAGDYDLILMDLQMPEMDGYTAISKLRAAGYQKPIIALTAHAMTEVRERVLRIGANAHLAKPIVPTELFSAIAELVQSRDS